MHMACICISWAISSLRLIAPVHNVLFIQKTDFQIHFPVGIVVEVFCQSENKQSSTF